MRRGEMLMAAAILAGACQATRADFVDLTAADAAIDRVYNPMTPLAQDYFSDHYSGDLTAYADHYGDLLVRSAVSFDLSSLPAGAVVTSAVLHLTVIEAQAPGDEGPGRPALLHVGGLAADPAITEPILAARSTFTASSGPLPDAYSFPPVPVQFDVTSLVISAEAGVVFTLGASLSATAAGISSGAEYAPSLAITYSVAVPEPGSLSLCGLAMAIGLAAAGFLRVARAWPLPRVRPGP